MPVYELSLILKVLPRADTAAALKRIGCVLMEKGATVQKLENFGMEKTLPYEIYAKEAVHRKGSYFVYRFMSTPKLFYDIKDVCNRDVDVIKHTVGPGAKDLCDPCTLDDEMKPPAYRKSVQDLLAKSKKNKQRTKTFFWYKKEWNFYDTYM